MGVLMDNHFLGIIEKDNTYLPSHSEMLKNRALATLFLIEDMTGELLSESEKGLKIRKHVLGVANDIKRLTVDKDLI